MKFLAATHTILHPISGKVFENAQLQIDEQ